MVIFRILDFYRLPDLVCPDFVGNTGLGCCIPPCFLVMFATTWERTLICWYWYWPWRVVEHVNDCCFRDIYKGGLWEEDLYVCVLNSGILFALPPSLNYFKILWLFSLLTGNFRTLCVSNGASWPVASLYGDVYRTRHFHSVEGSLVEEILVLMCWTWFPEVPNLPRSVWQFNKCCE